jgi:trk system potassium uptake protein TrkH
MNYRTVLRLVGVLVVFIGLSMSFSLFWSLYLDQTDTDAFLNSIGICLVSGGAMLGLGWQSKAPVLHKEGMAVVGLGWLLAALFGALPFYLSGVTPNFVDAYFEAMSGFTTTGSTILTDIESIPRGVLFWRSFTHWLGGMGIVVLFVAILPYLRAGGRQLFRSEVPGPTADVLRPRISETASVLWKIYVGFSAVQVLILYALGMTFYDSLCHTFGTMATGGFATKNASIGYYNSIGIDLTIILFMIFAGTNFGLYFRLIRGDWKALFNDPEWRFYIGIIFFAIVAITWNIWMSMYTSFGEALRFSTFQVASIITTTGFATADFDTWPSFSKLVLVALMFSGGCAGSTGGGMKIIRILVLLKYSYIGTEQAIRPHMVRTLKLGGVPVEDDVRNAIVVFFFISLNILLFCSLAMTAMGLDLVTATTSVIATLNNIGPGLARVGAVQNFAFVPTAGKLLLSLCMVLGRLELITILVLFMPSFWKAR